ncbi:hypothetical protein L1887_26317 [Cichorium endivia]|nr:hypothetical protein L1887_26317 [Cichorium endivia]
MLSLNSGWILERESPRSQHRHLSVIYHQSFYFSPRTLSITENHPYIVAGTHTILLLKCDSQPLHPLILLPSLRASIAALRDWMRLPLQMEYGTIFVEQSLEPNLNRSDP